MDEAAFRDRMDQLKTSCHGPDIAAALGLHGKGKRYFCPNCQADGAVHRTPDLDVFDQGFKCYKCGLSGDVIDLVVLAGQMTKAEAIRYLENRTGLHTKDRGGRAVLGPDVKIGSVKLGPRTKQNMFLRAEVSGQSSSALYTAFLDHVCGPVSGTPGADYLEGRGIAAAVADQYSVRYCADLSGLWKLADRNTLKAAGLSALYVFQKAALPFLVFPYMRQGQPVFIKTRCLLSKAEADGRELPRFLNTGGHVPCLWNHDAVAAADQVIIAEGEIDALSAIMVGLAAVGLPGWSHWKDAWTPDFAGKDVILVLDADEAGQKGTIDIARRFMKAGLPCPRQLALKEGKDLNDVLQEFMKDGKAESMND